MLIPFPNYATLQRDDRTLFYQAEEFGTGVNVEALIYTSQLKEQPKIKLTELKYGFYYFEYNFQLIGDYLIIMFENGVVKGASIFRSAL